MNFVDIFDYLANVAQVARGCPTPTLQHAYMRAFREWCQQTQWLRTNIQGQLIQGTQGLPIGRQYSLGSDPYVDIIGIYAMQGSSGSPSISPPGIQYWDLWPSNSATWDPNQQPSLPVAYQYIAEGQFAVNPLPQQDYQVNVTVIITPKENAVQVPESPLIKYSNDIEAGALEYLLMLPGQPWTDKNLAQVKGREFRSGISNGKAEAQRAYNTGAQRTVPRVFGSGNRSLWRGA
jgi:hypothetical protein